MDDHGTSEIPGVTPDEVLALCRRLELLEKTFRHTFAADEQSENAEQCTRCGLNIRDRVHERRETGPAPEPREAVPNPRPKYTDEEISLFRLVKRRQRELGIEPCRKFE